MKIARIATAAVAVAAAALWWWHLHHASDPEPIAATGVAAPATLQPHVPAAPQQSVPVTSPQAAAPASAGASAADDVVWQLCGMGSLTVSAADAAEVARANIDPVAALPDHLGSAAADAARPALLAALNAGPPRWQAAAVLLRGSDAAGQPALPALRELAAASADPVVAMWASELCLRGDACTASDSQRWLELEPDNLAPWLWKLASTTAGGVAQLPQMAAARRFDLHGSALLEVVLNAMPAAVTPYLQRQFWIEAMGIQAAFALPGSRQLTAVCAVPLDEGSPRRDACSAIARTMADRSDTVVGTTIGLGLAERSYMPPAEAKARRTALYASMNLPRGPLRETEPQPLSCAGIERMRTRLQRLATLGEMGSLQPASAPR